MRNWEHDRVPGRSKRGSICGKVVEVLFDCHGDFCGFVLEDCGKRRHLESRERAIGEVVLRACRENLSLCVRFCAETGRIEGLAVTNEASSGVGSAATWPDYGR